VQERAAAIGFDWDRPEPVFAKIEEEMDETRESWHAGDTAHAVEELGDVLFAVVNLLRFLNRNPEEVLVGTIKKFERRFREVEKAMRAEGRAMTLEEMDQVWERAKESERGATGDPPPASPHGAP
jgi:ATP diphosphatase